VLGHGGAHPPLAAIVIDAPVPSRRHAARLAAVQALYQWQEGQHSPEEIIEQFVTVRTNEVGEAGMRRDADKPLFKDIIEGVAAHKNELESLITAALAHDWTWQRVDRLVRAMLLAGVYELKHRLDVPARVSINEYVEVAHAFYDQGEPTFVNSVLDRVAREVRSAELVK
jgi:N utilization substance protein B